MSSYANLDDLMDSIFQSGQEDGIYKGYAMGIINAAKTCKNPSQASPIILNGIEYAGPEIIKVCLDAWKGERTWHDDLIYSLLNQNHIIKD